jgi:phage terminase large subunit-like protein
MTRRPKGCFYYIGRKLKKMGMRLVKKVTKTQTEKQQQAAEATANKEALAAMAMQLATLQMQIAMGGKA